MSHRRCTLLQLSSTTYTVINAQPSRCSSLSLAPTVISIPRVTCINNQQTPHALILIQLVELKNGVTFNGHLVDCDNFMNVTLREVYQTSADGERFWKMKEMFIKGNVVSLGACVLGLWFCAGTRGGKLRRDRFVVEQPLPASPPPAAGRLPNDLPWRACARGARAAAIAFHLQLVPSPCLRAQPSFPLSRLPPITAGHPRKSSCPGHETGSAATIQLCRPHSIPVYIL